jgi:DNA-binding transcriptional regulator YhcF (GntR family)
MGGNFEAAMRELQMAIFRVRERPPVGEPPDFVRNQVVSVGGLSPIATAVGLFFASTGKSDIGNEETFTAAELSDKLGLSPEETNDAIEELDSLGLVKTLNYLGTHPFLHGDIWPTYALFLHFRGQTLDYDPEEDIKTVAAAIAAQKQVEGQNLAQLTKLSPLRINRAVAYLEDYGIVRVIHIIGTAPFDFGTVWATGATRRFVAENCT